MTKCCTGWSCACESLGLGEQGSCVHCFLHCLANGGTVRTVRHIGSVTLLRVTGGKTRGSACFLSTLKAAEMDLVVIFPLHVWGEWTGTLRTLPNVRTPPHRIRYWSVRQGMCDAFCLLLLDLVGWGFGVTWLWANGLESLRWETSFPHPPCDFWVLHLGRGCV